MDETRQAVERARQAFLDWRLVPAPRRGEVVRAFGQRLREHKAELGELVSIETGKILAEGLGEVQELIDICDFAVGLSRQIYGLTIASERPGHRMMETWHPLGPCAVITAFNFPAAVWGWNAAIALVCGDPVVWKPSEKAALTALACQALLQRALAEFADLPQDISAVVLGDAGTAAVLVDDERVPLVSATGSTRMGEAVAPRLARAIRALDSRARREQRGDRRAERGPRHRRARNRLRRRGHRRPALHDAASADRARVDPCRPSRPACSAPTRACPSAIRWMRACWSAR